jgi:hypothetical protein
MSNRAVDEILASLRNAQGGMTGFQSLFVENGGLCFEPVAEGDLHEVFFLGMTGTGPTQTVALADWMIKVQHLHGPVVSAAVGNTIADLEAR